MYLNINYFKANNNQSLVIPKVNWDDVGGLLQAKNDIIETIMLPQLYPQIFDELIRPRTGLLFYGPPGTGKVPKLQLTFRQCSRNAWRTNAK